MPALPDHGDADEIAASLQPIVDGTRAATVADFEALALLEHLDSFRALTVEMCLFPDDAALAYDGWRRRSEVTT